MGAITPEERAAVRAASPLGAKYDTPVNRESAYEILKARAAAAPAAQMPASRGAATSRPTEPGREGGSLADDILFGRRGPRGGRQTQGLIEAMAKSAARSMGSQAGRALLRGVLGSLLGGRR